MRHRANADFGRNYEYLPSHIRDHSGKQFLVLKENPQHPSLQFKKIGDRLGQEVWSARVTLNDRAVAIKRLRDYLWFWIGDHKAYEHLIFIAKTRSSN